MICSIFVQFGEDGECVNGDGVGGEESEEVKRAKMLEVEAVRAAGGGSLGDALEQTRHQTMPLLTTTEHRSEREREREREQTITKQF